MNPFELADLTQAGWLGRGETRRKESLRDRFWSGRAVKHAPEEIDPSPSQSSQKGEGPLSRLHFGSLNTIPFQPKIQPCQRYLTFLPYEWKFHPVFSFLHKKQPVNIYISSDLF